MLEENDDLDEVVYTIAECGDCKTMTPLAYVQLNNGAEMHLCLLCHNEIDDSIEKIDISQDELELLGFSEDDMNALIDIAIGKFMDELADDEANDDFFNEITEIIL